MRRKITKASLVFLLLLLAGLLAWMGGGLFLPKSFWPAEIFVEVEKGQTVESVAGELQKKGIVRGKLPFLVGYRLLFYPGKIKAGEYAFVSPLRAKDVLEILVQGKAYLHSVTVPEGLTGREISTLVAPLLGDGELDWAAAFRETGLVAAFDQEAETLEGYLYPETYFFPRGVASAEAVAAMAGEFRTVFGNAWLARANSLRMSVRQVVTLASLVEKETAIPEEMRLISAVFHNRLRLGMKLDCDPTIIYALKERGEYAGRLGKKDMSFPSPYNTYLHPGLPPGPICNPGRQALEAALYPAEEGYIYFVSKNDGSHHFSRSFGEHQAAVRRFQKR